MPRLTSSGMARLLVAGLAGLGIAAGAASAQDAHDDPGRSQSIRLVNINGYSVIDREHLVLNGGASRHYLVTLRQRCSGLDFGARIGTSFPATTTLYPPFTEYVTVDEGPMQQRCYIDAVEEVESVDAARLLIEQRAEAEDGDAPS